jgi:uncharacterized protein YrrD
MDFHLHSDVRERDGLTVGELRHVVCDPETRQVISLVVQQSGVEGRAVIVPIGTVQSGDDDAVYLELDGGQFEALDSYAYARNVAPPPADVDPSTRSSDQLQEPIDVPDVPPVGAASGITSIAFTPVLEIWRNVPDGSLIFDDGTVIEATDGEAGHLRHVLADDETRRLTGLVVEEGFFFTQEVEVRMECVSELTSERIRLTVGRSALEPPYEE